MSLFYLFSVCTGASLGKGVYGARRLNAEVSRVSVSMAKKSSKNELFWLMSVADYLENENQFEFHVNIVGENLNFCTTIFIFHCSMRLSADVADLDGLQRE